MKLISRHDDRVVLTPQGADLLRQADSQYDEVAAARERRELRERQARANLEDWNAGAVDSWESSIAQRHRFARKPVKRQAWTVGDTVVAAIIITMLVVACYAFWLAANCTRDGWCGQ